MMRESTVTERELHHILWEVWSAQASGGDVTELAAALSPSASDVAIEILRECGAVVVAREGGLEPRVVELLAWSVFGTDSLPLLSAEERKERLTDAAGRWNVHESVALCLAVRAAGRLR